MRDFEFSAMLLGKRDLFRVVLGSIIKTQTMDNLMLLVGMV
jgi:hypothetical protein